MQETSGASAYLMVHDGAQAHDADVDVVASLPHVELGAVLGCAGCPDGVSSSQVSLGAAAQSGVQAGRLFVVQQLLSSATLAQSNL